MGARLWPRGATLGARGRLCAGLCHWRWHGLPFGGLVVIVNCCDEYGNCTQGRDCPVRVVRTSPPSISERLLRRFSYWLLIAILGVLWLAFLVAIVAAYA